GLARLWLARGHATAICPTTTGRTCCLVPPHRGKQRAMMKTLFLHPPSFDGFDGGAGARYQAKREIKSFWFPTWLAQPAALVPGSKLIDAPPARIGLDTVTRQAGDYELC